MTTDISTLPRREGTFASYSAANVKLSLGGGSIHYPTDPVGRLLFNVLAMVAEFETDLIRMRTRRDEGRQSQRPAARASS